MLFVLVQIKLSNSRLGGLCLQLLIFTLLLLITTYIVLVAYKAFKNKKVYVQIFV